MTTQTLSKRMKDVCNEAIGQLDAEVKRYNDAIKQETAPTKIACLANHRDAIKDKIRQIYDFKHEVCEFMSARD